jgi:hypothetical protein
MRIFIFAAFCAALLASSPAFARPISYPGGWMAMTMNDFSMNQFDLSYTVTPQLAVGLHHDYYRHSRVNSDAVQVTNLLKRWNMKDSQGNLYLQSGIGAAYRDGDQRLAGYTGLMADWESQRWFLSYGNHVYDSGNLGRYFHQDARIGVAPYIGKYGDLHTWLMLQVDQYTNEDKHFSVTPLVRVFKGDDLAEVGVNLSGGIFFHYMHNF